VIVPIYKNDEERSKVMPVVEKISQQLHDFRVKVDNRTEVTPGFKFNDWELRGVPVRIEVGPKDVEKNSVMVARRDIPGREGKQIISQESLPGALAELLTEIHASLFDRAKAFRDSHIFDPKDYEELKQIVEAGWAFSWWCGDPACEAKVKEDTRATTRCIPFEQPGGKGKCIVCGKEATEKVYFAKAY
jgi:prolyl-tRNA synthetase